MFITLFLKDLETLNKLFQSMGGQAPDAWNASAMTDYDDISYTIDLLNAYWEHFQNGVQDVPFMVFLPDPSAQIVLHYLKAVIQHPGEYPFAPKSQTEIEVLSELNKYFQNVDYNSFF